MWALRNNSDLMGINLKLVAEQHCPLHERRDLLANCKSTSTCVVCRVKLLSTKIHSKSREITRNICMHREISGINCFVFRATTLKKIKYIVHGSRNQNEIVRILKTYLKASYGTNARFRPLLRVLITHHGSF